MPTGPRYRGWRWDEDNDRLHVNIGGTDEAYFDSNGLSSGVAKTALPANFLNVTLVNGGSAGAHTVTGIAAGDEIVFVGHLSTAAAIATLADLTAEFTAATDAIDNTSGTDTTNDQLMVIWIDLT